MPATQDKIAERLLTHLRNWGRYECDVCCNGSGEEDPKKPDWAVEMNSTGSHVVVTCTEWGKAILFDMKYVEPISGQ